MSPPPSVSAASSRTEKESEDARSDGGRGWRFWIIFLALCMSLFLTALDLASVSTALPSIIHDLNGTDSFVWVSSAYNLACTAVLPLSGRLADIFGRREVLLVSILIFGAGSAVTAAAQSMNMLIAGRTIQGVGSGAIQVLVAIVTADLIPLKDRGFFQSLTGATFSLASAGGPFIGGAIAQRTTWRWLFYLNLPLCGIAFAVCLVFLRLRKPPIESYSKAFFAIDWIGNAIIIGSATSCILALTWAGIQYPWSSPQVIVPLVIGLVGFGAALVYDRYYASHPVVPAIIINNRTSLGGYIASFLHGLVVNSVAFYLPTYFQAAKIATPLLSGLYLFPSAITISPSAIAQGIIISKTGKYRVIQVIGWCAMLLGVGLLTILDENTSVAISIPFQIIAAVGFGFLYATTFSVLAPLDPTQNAAALSFLLFVRTLSSAWAISISATILQNQLRTHLPPAFLAQIPPGHDIAYSAIPIIPTLAQPLQAEVRAAFADSIRLIWHVLLAFAAAGLLSVLLQKDVALHSKMDRRWGMKEHKKGGAGAAEEGVPSRETDTDTDTEKPVVVDVAEGQLGGEVQVLPGDALQPQRD
ncbi:iron permease [Polyporus arcularius HHB13444]|uniref:Iron permease n=1 Tax=Polyporus arcularius HHB13444 TaxID=1314778 RepID=A0A5C3PNC4_9APHY|nr:iron permease [Polyporus arcularius HHB13444]